MSEEIDQNNDRNNFMIYMFKAQVKLFEKEMKVEICKIYIFLFTRHTLSQYHMGFIFLADKSSTSSFTRVCVLIKWN